MKTFMTCLFLFPLFALAVSSPSPAAHPKCLEKRGAIDVGSGSTKAVVAIVDICHKTLKTILFEEQMKVSFSEAHEKSAQGNIPEDFLKEQAPKYAALAARMKKAGAVSSSGLATSVFRKAKNGKEAIEKISAALGFPVQIISQKEEAELGYWSALAKRPAKKNERIAVWDIGGGSMQITARDKDSFQLYEGNLASVGFKNKIIRDLQKKDPAEVSSPNPVGPDWTRAVDVASTYAEENLPAAFKSSGKKFTWLGIGGVLSKSLPNQLDGAASYSLATLKKALKERSAFNDEKLGGEFAATDVSNLALVAGFMEALGANSVETVNSSLEQGWLLSHVH